MGNNSSIKNLSLATFVGLFAFYSFSAYNFRIGSLSSDGLVIKYSKRGLASDDEIKCPPSANAIDETTVDSLGDSDCFHHVDIKTLENFDIEYTVTTYFKGYTSTGSKIFSAEEATEDNHNEEFIVSLVRKSKAKFDVAEAAEVARKKEEAESASDDEDAEEDVTPKPAKDGKPAITVSSKDDDKDDDDAEETDSDEDAEILMEAIESYAQLKIDYNSCQVDSEDDKKIKKLIKKYDKTLKKYIAGVEKYDNSDDYGDDDARTPFEKLTTRGRKKLDDFVSEIDELDSSDDDSDDDELSEDSSQSQLSCLLKRSKSITNKEAQFNHYVENIQPLLRQEMQNATPESFDQITKALNEGSNPISELASSNPFIKGSVQADFLGAKARVLHAENKRLQLEAQGFSEPMKTTALKNLRLQSDQINSELATKLSKVALNNPMLADHLGGSGQFWAQQIQPFELIGQDLTDNPGAVVTQDDKHLRSLQRDFERMKRMKATRRGTGNARNQTVTPQGEVRFNPATGTREYKGNVVPRLGDDVRGNGAVN